MDIFDMIAGAPSNQELAEKLTEVIDAHNRLVGRVRELEVTNMRIHPVDVPPVKTFKEARDAAIKAMQEKGGTDKWGQ